MFLLKVQIRSRIFMVTQRLPPFLSFLLPGRPQWCLGRPHSSLLGCLCQAPSTGTLPTLCLPGLTDLESKQGNWEPH